MTGPGGAGAAGAAGRAGPAGDPLDDPLHDEVRRVLEEATRLVEALGGLPAGHAGDECRICPFCRVLSALRELRPEVLDHLGAAAAELLAAVREFTAAPRPGAGERSDEGAGEGPDAGSGEGSLRPAAGPDPVADAVPPVPDAVPLVAARPPAPPRPAVQHIEITD